MDNFDLKKYLVENKVTRNSRLNEGNYDTANNVMAIINQLTEMGNEGKEVLTILERIPEWNELVSANQDIDFEGEDKLKEAEETSPEQAVSKAVKVAPKLEKSPEMDKLADKIANDTKMLQQLEKALAKGGVMMNEAIGELDSGDLETLALNYSKKGEKMNEGISSDPAQDDVSAGLGMLAFTVGGTIAANFSSAIAAAIPAVGTAFAGPALLGALAGVALFVLARKVYLKMNPDK